MQKSLNPLGACTIIVCCVAFLTGETRGTAGLGVQTQVKGNCTCGSLLFRDLSTVLAAFRTQHPSKKWTDRNESQSVEPLICCLRMRITGRSCRLVERVRGPFRWRQTIAWCVIAVTIFYPCTSLSRGERLGSRRLVTRLEER